MMLEELSLAPMTIVDALARYSDIIAHGYRLVRPTQTTAVEAYDAMTSFRVYQKSLTAAEARAELQRCAGHQFDPRVVAAFLQVLDKQGALPGEELSGNANVYRHPASFFETMAESSVFKYMRKGRPYEV